MHHASSHLKRLYCTDDKLIFGHLKQVIADHEIPCVAKNEYLSGAAGDLPLNECWPELWVVDDADFPRACAIRDALLEPSENPAGAWRCCGCGETIEAQFTECWRCGTARPEVREG